MIHLIKSSAYFFRSVFCGTVCLRLFSPSGRAVTAVREQKQGGSIRKPVGTEQRIALVIGNANYAHLNDLRNPLNDVNDMEKALQKLDFEVIKVLNASNQDMQRDIGAFRLRLRSADVAFFYYSGYGVSLGSENYLMPFDFDPNRLRPNENRNDVIPLSWLLDIITSTNVKNSFVIIDACIYIPAQFICEFTKRDLSNTAFVKPTNNPLGSVVVYATEEGTKAEDRSPNGRNGLFTGALLQYLTTPDLSLRNILDQASLEVERLSNGSQTPARYDKIYGDFYFLNTKGYTPPPSRDLPPFMEMVRIEGGGFNREGYDITVSSFMMGKHEVTVGQFAQFVAETNYKTDAEGKSGGSEIVKDRNWIRLSYVNWRYDEEGNVRPSGQYDYPVIHVSHNDAVAFCEWLSRKEGKNYRLPTEAEWEYAAGGGSNNRTIWAGTNELCKLPHYCTFVDFNSKLGFNYSSPVGILAANGLGFHDMSGNVWEWCSDWYGDYPKSSLVNPTGPATGTLRVIRGGSWEDASYKATVATRNCQLPGYRDHITGFRLVSQAP